MTKLEVKNKENPKLQHSTLSDGRISLYLEYYLGRSQWIDEETGKIKVKHDRRKETLNLYLIATPRTPIERQTNKDTLELAKEIRIEREQELKRDRTGKRLTKIKKINFFDFIQAYYDDYTKGDKRMIKAAQKRFTDFINLEYPLYHSNISPDKITPDMMGHFVEYMQSISKGEGALTHWKRWKKIVKAAVNKDILRKNPCEGIVCKADEEALKKDILSLDEIEQLIKTTYPGQNPHTRKAFIFAHTKAGKRFFDIKD
ncbi:hypothetical protein EZS27_021598 [termite gut metagenome]|uniref:Phage integrase SAM-like domain-containing protein n=1 Tax=termite gut metagenome TaxID=433724 RepID=A0A5J4R7B1_9ZZZZ